MKAISFFDIEASAETGTILDIGCIRSDDAKFHKNSIPEFLEFIKGNPFLCGHNIILHDLKMLQQKITASDMSLLKAIDTLVLSPLLFPQKPYHRLLKDDKMHTEEANNPFNDAVKARELFLDEVDAFNQLSNNFKTILFNLLQNTPGFAAFFEYLQFNQKVNESELIQLIKTEFREHICAQTEIETFIQNNQVSFAYALALINCNDRFSITPHWVLKNYPEVEQLYFLLRNTPCLTGCSYCNKAFDPFPVLNTPFGYQDFRKYNDEPLQENAVRAAVNNKSLLCIFPTGGGKSITFQIPALMAAKNAKALTVVISPLQSLMKDQVDNLDKKGITEAVTINGLLDPIARSEAIERVETGNAALLYISPESLRSVTIERLLLKRKIARFVIDEAHCFSSWGQDFRVDYLYIGDFIRELQHKKNLEHPIPVSCFTATAKLKVIEDIRSYFKEKLNLNLETFSTNAPRTNLHYRVFQKEKEDDKYNHLRSIIENKNCPTIVYVSRTKRASTLAKKLTDDGFAAKCYHGKLSKEEKKANQNAFMTSEVNIMVATSAFGMGVDKDNVGAVIHYDISDSLENYIQEAGRAGRDENINADCYVLFNGEDLDKHFILLNQTKISSKEINQIWKAIKELTKTRDKVSNSALEIARKAGWDDSINEIETRVITAVAALEDAGYLKRGQNMPRVFASSILSKTAQEAINSINASQNINPDWKPDAIRIIKKLFSSKSKRLSTEEQAESRIDYISDQLGMTKDKVIRIVELLREEKILANNKDLTAFIENGVTSKGSLLTTEAFRKLENFLLNQLHEQETDYHLKELNELALEQGIKESTPVRLKTIINFWSIKNWVKKQFHQGSKHHVKMMPELPVHELRAKLQKRHELAQLIVTDLYNKALEIKADPAKEEVLVEFSVLELKDMLENRQSMFKITATIDDVEDTLFYLSRIEAIKIEGGFLVVHNRLSIDRLEKNNRIKYKETDYEKLAQFYEQKVQQIHIVGEYAKKMIRNYNEALQFVNDYFALNYSSFLSKYFPGSRQTEIKRTLTPEKFKRLFGDLSVNQLEIVNDAQHQNIVVAAGPGSGKTRVLVHKLASLLLAEDVKHEQLLMLTFSRAAATEFKKRLMELIDNAAAFIEINTFHSYCFDLLGRVGSIGQSGDIVKTAVEKIRNREIETNRITKTVLVIDEAQDMNADEFSLVKALMELNEEMRVILVGDDDQNIYGFRGADSRYMQQLLTEDNAVKYELTENYRSKANIVTVANQWVSTIQQRLKSQPGFSSKNADAIIAITEYNSNNLLVPLAEAVRATDLAGTTCILTKTNEEAMLLTGLLQKQGIAAKLIQSNDGFNLSNLYELRFFSDIILANEDSPLIHDDDWSNAIQQLNQHVSKSNKLPLARSIITAFGEVNVRRKYKSDWKAFLAESKMEDFIAASSDTIYVSTIHKAKGKEFDNVFILLDQLKTDNDESKRQLYVAITRAKNNLHMHCNQQYLRPLSAEQLTYRNNNNPYPEPEHLTLLLGHRDVQLGYFEYVQQRLHNLYSGSPLTVTNDGLANKAGQPVLKFAAKCNQALEAYVQKGYQLKAASVNCIVHWYNEKTEKESKIILPELYLVKE